MPAQSATHLASAKNRRATEALASLGPLQSQPPSPAASRERAWTLTLGQRLRAALAALCVIALHGCSRGEHEAFNRSHDSIRVGMTVREAFGAGLADYLITQRPKSVAGATPPDSQLVRGCARHVLEILYNGVFHVRVYCGVNAPSAPRLVPDRTFDDEDSLLRALGTDYASWGRRMVFRVESPPRGTFGRYDHYDFVTGPDGRIVRVSEIIIEPPAR